MNFAPNPINAARNEARNKGTVGQRITYRDAFTSMEQDMLIESVATASDGVNRVYMGSGNRAIHSRYVKGIV